MTPEAIRANATTEAIAESKHIIRVVVDTFDIIGRIRGVSLDINTNQITIFVEPDEEASNKPVVINNPTGPITLRNMFD